MQKTIIKEIIIMLLLLLAIILALGVLFYDYIPISKVVPVIEQYKTSNTVTESLQNDILADTTNVIVTREIDGTDLSVYEQSKDYKKGKANPFESIVTTTNSVQNQGQVGSGTTVNNNNNNISTNNTENQNTNENTNTNGQNNTNINTNEASDENDYLSNTNKYKGSK